MKNYGILTGVILLFLLYFLWEMKQIRVSRYTLSFKKLPKAFDGCCIVHLSDLHGNVFGRGQERLLAAIAAEKPDYLVITGDMVTDCYGSAVPGVISLLKKLAEKYPVYYEPGNHETRALEEDEENRQAYDVFCRQVKESGAVYLENEKISWQRKGQKIEVYGLALERKYFGKFWNLLCPELSHLEELLGRADRDSFNLLLAHHPDYFPLYEKWGADLVLSGHIHGGIARLPVLGGVLSPVMRLFPKYDGGVYEGERPSCKMVLSRGLGSHTIPLRPFNPPELVVVRLETGNSSEFYSL